MSQMLPYILPLIIGRTFNLDRMQVGVDIFPKEVFDRTVIIQNPVSETHYKIVDNVVEARDLLDVGGSFSLNVKSGVFKAGASGEYLSDTYDRSKTVEIAVRASYQTVTEQLPMDAKPIDTWKVMYSKEALGTHFVRSITYGGELIAAIRFICNDSASKEKIKGAVEIGGRIKGIDLGLEVEGGYEKEISNNVESTQIKIFSSIPLSEPPNDMHTLNRTLDVFPNDLRDFNDGRGVPLKMELWPLSMLDATMEAHVKDKLLEAKLDSFEEKFDDLLNTKTAISDWLKAMRVPLTEDQEKKVGQLYKSVSDVSQVLYETIGNLDLSKSTKQLEKAEKAYGTGLPGTYYRKYLILRHEIAKDQGAWTYSKGNGITYTHWGKKTCQDAAEKVSQGIVVGPKDFGGGANFLCLSSTPNFGVPPKNQNDASIVEGSSFELPGNNHSQLFCSICRLGARGSIQVFLGRTTCPNDWEYVYDGLLMSGTHGTESTRFVCLDKNADMNKDFVSKNPIIPNWAYLVGKQTDAGEQVRELFPCAVCAQ